ncbi:MAG: thioredoxin [Ardenticatenaceae bacterium]|nr:thioredoxin [Ardenticatenaceae bacterium]MCB8990009.1 thioredoxin [Ardenticatenaceae bacterium]
MIVEIGSDTFECEVLEAEMPVVVDVWAPWCGPCRIQAPIFAEAAQQFAGEALFVKLNADENQDLVRRYKIMGIPTMLFFRHGRLVERKTGVQSKEAIAKRLEPLLTMLPEQAEKQEITGLFRWPFRRR